MHGFRTVGGTRLEGISATASYGHFMIVWMDIRLHLVDVAFKAGVS